MSYLKLVEKIIREQDKGVGYEPLIQEFVTDINTLTPKEKEDRELKIRNYYQSILGRTNNLTQAYKITRNWANKIFIQPYVQKTLDKIRGENV